MQDLSFLLNAHPSYVDQLYKDYMVDPTSVEAEWRNFFTGYDFAINSEKTGNNTDSRSRSINTKEFKVVKLIYAYRNKGHLISDTNPIRPRKDRHADLDLHFYDLGEDDMETKFYGGNELGLGTVTLREILAHLKEVYCRTIGWEYNYIDTREERQWLREKIEHGYMAYEHPYEKKKRILQKLNDSNVYEKFLGTKFIGQKRFSLEGGESLIPALDAMINVAANEGCKEVVIGMAHRGRLNVLVNIVRKTYEEIFAEFEGVSPDNLSHGTGDVKYHKGFSSQYTTMDNKEVYINLLPNPSHLEAVNPVVQGWCRAKADEVYESEYDAILPLTIHGDAAIAGQGIVYEVLQMSLLKGYTVGGTVHFVINNQIGFTTDFDDARSSYYCTSVASTVQAPVFHVNGDDVEAVTFVSELAVEYRQKFNKDVFVDMVSYRKHGHNEGDDPQYTQPQMYSFIKNHVSVRDIYNKKLMDWGVAGAELVKDMEKAFWGKLQRRLDDTKQNPRPYRPQATDIAWDQTRTATQEDFEKSPKTKISKANLVKIIKALVKVPEGFHPLKKVNHLLESRREIMRDQKSVDWAAGELIGYGSILLENHDVRMSGEDVKRGTFSHRHAMVYDEKTGDEYNRLNHIIDDPKEQGKFRIFNSHLSEYGVLGFEFGYSLTSPQGLIVWEAQFGDFVNGAQIILDQFIASCETKWNKNTGMILLLPHGYEGAGPEHSSARLERFLQACAELNMVITNITTPANLFHAIRRQLAWDFRKPLVNMSPKSLLRHPDCVSDVKELYDGHFYEFIDDENIKTPSKVKRLVFCSGKVYYDLLKYQRENKREDVALVRIEQLYPLAFTQLDAMIKKYSKAKIYWTQEEPSNMGAWWYLRNTCPDIKWNLVARPAKASPATGFHKIHEQEQKSIVDQSFNG
ncbi:MAG TPA: 2-oxoglutarate dehydrogenase E1 component [Chitinophagales bacterium]|nr:2-oxoglutarate dehydrogenase E1 component [Chitinophagales bacterium]